MTVNIKTPGELAASFPHGSRPNLQLVNQLSLHVLIKIFQYLVRCSATASSAISACGFLYLICPQQYWDNYANGNPYPNDLPLEKPSSVPDYSDAIDANDRETITKEHEVKVTEFETAKAMNTALINELCACMGTHLSPAIQTTIETQPDIPIMQVMAELAVEYTTTEEEREENMQRMKTPWNPSTGFVTLVQQLKEGVMFSYFCQRPLQESTVVDIGVSLIKATKVYTEEYKTWSKIPETEHTVQRFMDFWGPAIKTVKAANGGNTATSMGFVNHTEEIETDDDVLDTVMEKFSEASAAQASSYDLLAKQNHALSQQIQQQSQQMQQQQAANSQLQMMMMMQQMTGGNNKGGQRNGKKKQQQQQQQPTTPGFAVPGATMMPMCPPVMQMQMQMQQQSRQPNNVKRFECWTYCHTHGCDVAPTHTSMTCTKPDQGHQMYATRNNPMGGSMKGQHKTILPSAVGKECASKRSKKQQQPMQQQPNWSQLPMPQQPMANNMMGLGVPMQTPTMQMMPQHDTLLHFWMSKLYGVMIQ